MRGRRGENGVFRSEADLRPTRKDEFGQRYILDFAMTTVSGSALIGSAWIVRTGDTVLRLTTCYVLEERP